MKNTIFSAVMPARNKRSNFDLSHERKLSCNMGDLVPILVQEVLPGDKFKIDTQTLVRFAPLVSPVMHRINTYIHFFYVPNRIIWPDWDKFIVGDPSVPEVPTYDLCNSTHNFQSCKLADHLGLPLGTFTRPGEHEYINTLPFRAYMKIWNDYYRDENLQTEVDIEDDEINVISSLKTRSWDKDYFTSALPWAQKGDPVTVGIDLERNTPTKATGIDNTLNGVELQLKTVGGNEYSIADNQGNNDITIRDIESAEFSIESLRLAERLQRFLERNARAGTRYVEHLLAHWGVLSSDARLQRPEYLGGGVSPVIVSEVLSTSMTLDPAASTPELVNPVGQMAGKATNVGRTNQAYKFVEDHGWIIGIMSIMPEPGYMNQGIARHLSRTSQMDYYFPEFATLGEQEIKVKELYYPDTFGQGYDPESTFGYQQRWAEYKYTQSTCHGEFRESALEYWHLNRKFEAEPQLDGLWLECNPGYRIFAVTDSKTTLYVQAYNKVWASRLMPYESIPY